MPLAALLPFLPAIIEGGKAIYDGIQNNKAQKASAAAQAKIQEALAPYSEQALQMGSLGMDMVGGFNQGYGQQMNALQNAYAQSFLTPEQAMQMASGQIGNAYDVQLRDQLNQLRNNQLSRGFYGQAVGDAMNLQTAANVLGQKQQAINALGNQLYSQGQDRAQQYMGQMNNLLGQYGQFGLNLGQQGQQFGLQYGGLQNDMVTGQNNYKMGMQQNQNQLFGQIGNSINQGFGNVLQGYANNGQMNPWYKSGQQNPQAVFDNIQGSIYNSGVNGVAPGVRTPGALQ